MRLILQACALLLAIAVFPLPTSTNSALPTYSLSDIISRGSASKAPYRAPADLPGGQQNIGAPSSTISGNNAGIVVVQRDVEIASINGNNHSISDALSTSADESAAERPAKPQAVIATDFEKGGLSEGSFRTMGSLDENKETVEEKILVIGDSLSIPLGKRLEEYFSTLPGILFKRLGKVSSGLARPDFFDWERTLSKLADSMKPSTVVIMIGTNDNQSLKRADGSTVHFSDEDWDKEYTRRINRLFEICRKNNPDVNIFWVGAPIMGRPDLTKDVKRINTVIKSLCEANQNCYYIDTWDALADERGRFTDYLVDNSGEKVRVRATDGVHLSFFGAEILAGRTLRAMAPNVTMMRSILEAEPSG